jgi:predicted nucleic acid-binding protein
MYAVGTAHKYQSPCQIIMRLIASDEIYGVTNTEILQEVLYRYSCLGRKNLGIQAVETILSIIHEVLPVEKVDIILALNLLKNYHKLNVRDAIHAATALRNGFKYFLSVDKHFDEIKGLERVDPMEI